MRPSYSSQTSALGFIDAVRADMRRVFRISVVLAALVHIGLLSGLIQLRGPTKEAIERAAERPLPVKFFIRRDPRVTKPFDLRKATQPKRQLF